MSFWSSKKDGQSELLSKDEFLKLFNKAHDEVQNSQSKKFNFHLKEKDMEQTQDTSIPVSGSEGFSDSIFSMGPFSLNSNQAQFSTS